MGEACYRLFESGLKSSSVIYFTQMRENLMSNDTKDKSISDIESELHLNLNELGRRLLQEHIDSRGNGNVGNAILSDGKKLPNKRNRKRNMESMFGEVEVKRIEDTAPIVEGLDIDTSGNWGPFKIKKGVTYEFVLLNEDFFHEFKATQCEKLIHCDFSKPEEGERYLKEEIYRSACFKFFSFIMNRFLDFEDLKEAG